ncbi:hypothetical protein CTA1_1587 [Colletotrichum tanaceti]|uniref:Uncharacterized protein n=1 Tax=Colletotrichum tanaceti TaxID=1306861 RepID=A0A4U6X0C2_9PEZI|nr:hypothetical protein CTA1_1587 [Colletotrichum tanaceti]
MSPAPAPASPGKEKAPVTGHVDNTPPMEESLSPVPGQADSQYDGVQQPLADIHPGPESLPKPSCKGSESGTLWPEFPSEISVKGEGGAEDNMSESLKHQQQPGQQSLSLPKTLRPAVSAPSPEDEAAQEDEEDPSRRVQRLMVDKVMSSFMHWLDTKLKVKDESASQEPEALLQQVPAWRPSTGGHETKSSRFLTADRLGRAGVITGGPAAELGSAPLYSAPREIDLVPEDSTPARAAYQNPSH